MARALLHGVLGDVATGEVEPGNAGPATRDARIARRLSAPHRRRLRGELLTQERETKREQQLGPAVPWEPDILVTGLALLERHAPTGAHRLILAILRDAVQLAVKPPLGRFAVDRQEAWEWMVTDDALSPFSFVNVCLQLGIEPDWIRRGVSAQRQGARTDARDPRVRDLFRPVVMRWLGQRRAG